MTRAVITHGPRRDDVVAEPDVDMTTWLAGLELPSPVLTASGCAAAGRELDQFFDITSIGAVVTKSIMLNPRSGRPTPRMAETPSGMLNSIGLQGRASTRSWTRTSSGCAPAGPARSSRSPAARSTSTRDWPPSCGT
jgi:hypothetical protein